MQLPVVACRAGLTGWSTERHQLGELVDPTVQQTVTDAINRLADDEPLRWRYGRNGAELAARHRPEVFGERLCDVIAAATLSGRRARG
jgi:glycosyltransferase involved in cell wall biosynthesis